MNSSAIRDPCVKCPKGGGIATCGGCGKRFCGKHFNEHRQELTNQIEHICQDFDLLQQDLNEQNGKHPFISRVNDWEKRSIEKIQMAAEEARKDMETFLDENRTQLKTAVYQITKDLRDTHGSDDYTEIDIDKYIEQLKQLRLKFEKPSTIDIIDDHHIQTTIRVLQRQEQQTMDQTQTQIINKPIGVSVSIQNNDRWIQHGITVAGGYRQGDRLNQLYGPHGLYMNHDKTLYIADYDNHRILEWKHGATSAHILAGGNGRGNRLNRLDNPLDVILDEETNSLIICDRNNRRVIRCSQRNRANEEMIISNINCQGLAMDNEGFIYVSDSAKHEVRRYQIGDNNGIIVAGGNGKGDRLNQLNFPANIFVDQEKSIYISDTNNHRVIKWIKKSKEGIIVAGGCGKGNKLSQLSNPRGVIVDALGNIYVVDGWNHRVMRWSKELSEGCLIVGGNGQGEQANQLNYPEGLALDTNGSLYVADCLNNRIQRFDIQRN